MVNLGGGFPQVPRPQNGFREESAKNRWILRPRFQPAGILSSGVYSMHDIASIANGSVGPLHKATGPGRDHDLKAEGTLPRAAHEARPDRVEVSRFASWLQSLRQMPSSRSDKIDAVRSAIDAGGYETSEKYDQAINNLLQDLQD